MTEPRKTCINCKFYQSVHMVENGECRKRPPVPFIYHDPKNDKDRVVGEFPPTNPLSWCGEFEEVEPAND